MRAMLAFCGAFGMKNISPANLTCLSLFLEGYNKVVQNISITTCVGDRKQIYSNLILV